MTCREHVRADGGCAACRVDRAFPGDGPCWRSECRVACYYPDVCSEASRFATWCDGTPHAPDAIPPLPFHDLRFDMDNPWLVCARCGASDAALTLVDAVAEADSKALAEHLAGSCYLSEWSCSHCEAAANA